jgi:hypothetical protein
MQEDPGEKLLIGEKGGGGCKQLRYNHGMTGMKREGKEITLMQCKK